MPKLFKYIQFILLDISFQVFLRAVELSPDVGHSKYMYLGQIHTGQEAVDYYIRGIEVLLSALNQQMTVSAQASVMVLA